MLIGDRNVHPATTNRHPDGGVLGGTPCHPYSTRNATHRIHSDTDDSVIKSGDMITGRIEEPQADITDRTFPAEDLGVLGGNRIATPAQEEGRLEASYAGQQ